MNLKTLFSLLAKLNYPDDSEITLIVRTRIGVHGSYTSKASLAALELTEHGLALTGSEISE